MSDNLYTGKDQDRRYRGEDIDVTYNAKRCIHAAECVRRLSSVFDTQRRPWIQPDGAAADSVAEVVLKCPSGALHYERTDGGAAEPTPAANRVTLWTDGPLQLEGDLSILGAQVALQDETRATLCRCGASENKPFCDNTHKKNGFSAPPPATIKADAAEQAGKLTVTAQANGSLQVEGHFTIFDADGNIIFSGEKTWLCRCGASSHKPFCDGTHKSLPFIAD